MVPTLLTSLCSRINTHTHSHHIIRGTFVTVQWVFWRCLAEKTQPRVAPPFFLFTSWHTRRSPTISRSLLLLSHLQKTWSSPQWIFWHCLAEKTQPRVAPPSYSPLGTPSAVQLYLVHCFCCRIFRKNGRRPITVTKVSSDSHSKLLPVCLHILY